MRDLEGGEAAHQSAGVDALGLARRSSRPRSSGSVGSARERSPDVAGFVLLA
jgi:hypothetical protein